MAAKKKTNSKKTRVSLIVDRFDGTIVEQPLAVANKAVLASLGFATQIRTDFEEKYNDLARDGEKVRNEVENSIENLQGRVSKQVKTARKQVEKRVASAFNMVLDYSRIAKSSDVEKLNTKLDKVLLQVAK